MTEVPALASRPDSAATHILSGDACVFLEALERSWCLVPLCGRAPPSKKHPLTWTQCSGDRCLVALSVVPVVAFLVSPLGPHFKVETMAGTWTGWGARWGTRF